MSKRIIFTFSDDAATELERLRDEFRFKSLADVVRRGMDLMSVITRQGARGYSEIILRNPKSGREKEIILPALPSNRRN